MTVKLTATLPKGFTWTMVEFNVDHQPHPCKQSANNFVVTSGQTEWVYHLFTKEHINLNVPLMSGLKWDNSIDPRWKAECINPDQYQIVFQDIVINKKIYMGDFLV